MDGNSKKKIRPSQDLNLSDEKIWIVYKKLVKFLWGNLILIVSSDSEIFLKNYKHGLWKDISLYSQCKYFKNSSFPNNNEKRKKKNNLFSELNPKCLKKRRNKNKKIDEIETKKQNSKFFEFCISNKIEIS